MTALKPALKHPTKGDQKAAEGENESLRDGPFNRVERLEPLSPLGRPMTLDDLPPPTTRRWVARRKAEVVAAVRGGLLTLNEACERYGLSKDEYQSWERLFESHGVKGLQTTRIQVYRAQEARKAAKGTKRVKSDSDAPAAMIAREAVT